MEFVFQHTRCKNPLPEHCLYNKELGAPYLAYNLTTDTKIVFDLLKFLTKALQTLKKGNAF